MSNLKARLESHNKNPYKLEGKYSINSEPLLVSNPKANSQISKQPTYSQRSEQVFESSQRFKKGMGVGKHKTFDISSVDNNHNTEGKQ